MDLRRKELRMEGKTSKGKWRIFRRGQGGRRDWRLGPPFTKAQGGEMIGLLVIVILMIVIFAVYVSFSLKPESKGEEARVSSANNYLVSSMLNSNICPGKSLEDAIKAWGNNDKACQQDNMDEFIEQEADAMLKAYFGKRYEINGKKPFTLTIKPAEGSTKTPITIGETTLNCGTGGIMPSESYSIGRVAKMQVKTCVSLAQ